MRTLVVSGKIGPAFSGTHSRSSQIGSTFEFGHNGEFSMLVLDEKRDFWLLGSRLIPTDVIDFWRSPSAIDLRFLRG